MIWETLVQAVADMMSTDLTTAGIFLSATIISALVLAVAGVSSGRGEAPVTMMITALFGVMIFTALGWIVRTFGILLMFGLAVAVALYVRKAGG